MTITERIHTLEKYYGKHPCPEDFQQVWQAEYQAMEVPVLTSQPVPFQNAAAVYQQLTFQATDGHTLTARYIRPAGEGPFPTLFFFHDLGRSCRGWHHMTRFVALGYAVAALQNRTDPQNFQELRQCYRDALSLCKAVCALSETDSGHLATWGEGFGGGLAIAAAALLGENTRCAALHPMPTELDDPYLDVENFSSQLTGSLLLGTALMDTVACPEGQYAAFHRAACEKRHLVYPKYAHERINAFENQHIQFLNFWESR